MLVLAHFSRIWLQLTHSDSFSIFRCCRGSAVFGGDVIQTAHQSKTANRWYNCDRIKRNWTLRYLFKLLHLQTSLKTYFWKMFLVHKLYINIQSLLVHRTPLLTGKPAIFGPLSGAGDFSTSAVWIVISWSVSCRRGRAWLIYWQVAVGYLQMYQYLYLLMASKW